MWYVEQVLDIQSVVLNDSFRSVMYNSLRGFNIVYVWCILENANLGAWIMSASLLANSPMHGG